VQAGQAGRRFDRGIRGSAIVGLVHRHGSPRPGDKHTVVFGAGGCGSGVGGLCGVALGR
jgi:hypothetical protein